ncbi:MAG TPA: hypothetical protein VGN11_07615 [Candidatus Baltobacteraceae bacterium]|jgi:hypothetical protein|nr:hypothetical protein [Candidatus Baltobacteraceae bacterium]
MNETYREGMFDVASSLQAGLQSANDRLTAAQGAVARANANEGGTGLDPAMAQTARSAIFSEALLGAIHARLAEIKAVTK